MTTAKRKLTQQVYDTLLAARLLSHKVNKGLLNLEPFIKYFPKVQSWKIKQEKKK